MKKRDKQLNKIRRLLRRLGHPRWLHRFGPKTYDLADHVRALVVKTACQLSYRRVVFWLRQLGVWCPSKSALQAMAQKLPGGLWGRLLALTAGSAALLALDSTGFSRTNPSYHYLRRIDGVWPKVPIKLTAAVGTRRKKVCAARIRVRPAHEVRDFRILIRTLADGQCFVVDKAGNVNALYRLTAERGALLMSPPKRGVFRGRWRRQQARRFRLRTYRRRAMIEAVFSSLKRKFGPSVRAKRARTIRTEVYLRLLCHNLYGWLHRDSGQSRLAK